MSKEKQQTETLADRIRERLDDLKKTARSASLEAGRGPDAIRSIFRAEVEGIKRSPRIDTIEAIAETLETTVYWLTEGKGPKERSENSEITKALRYAKSAFDRADTVSYGGESEAGAWREIELFADVGEKTIVAIPRDPRYPACDQYAIRIRGDSMDRAGIEDGMFALVADWIGYVDHYGEPAPGRAVIVERTRNSGHEIERTCKAWVPDRARRTVRLEPRSSNPKHETITVPTNHEATGEEIRIAGLVLSAARIFGNPLIGPDDS